MMKINYILFGLLLLSSCFTPRDRRSTYRPQYSDDQSGISQTSNEPYVKPLDLPTTLPTGGSHCSFSPDGETGFEKFSSHIGRFNICQSKTSDAQIYFQLKSPTYDNRICLIPTYHNSGSYNSIYLGEAKCLFMTNPKNVETIQFIKNRLSPSGSQIYAHYPVTGVIIVKDKSYFYPSPFSVELNSVDAYKRCNQMLDIGNPSYCQAFKALGEYSYVTFRD